MMFAVELYPSKTAARRVFSPLWLVAQKQLESCVVQELHLGEWRLLLLVLVICSGCSGVTFVLGVCRSNNFCALQAFPRSFSHDLHPQSAGGMQLKRHVLLLLQKWGRPGQKPIMSRAGLSSPMDAIELTLTCLAKECRIALLICLARESRALQNFPLVSRSVGRAYVVLHNQCFRGAKNTFFVACRDRLSHKVQ